MNEDLKVEEGPNTLVSQNSNAGDNKTPKNLQNKATVKKKVSISLRSQSPYLQVNKDEGYNSRLENISEGGSSKGRRSSRLMNGSQSANSDRENDSQY